MVFSQIVDSGSISAAADSLGVSKSVVSQQLKALESELGAKLLKRTTRQQTLTPIGRDFYVECKKIKSITKKAWDDVRDNQIEPVGPITISAPHALIDSIISPVIGELTSRYSKLEPTIIAKDEMVDLVKDGIDLSICVWDMPPSEYKRRTLGYFNKIFCASPEYIHRQDLLSLTLVNNPDDSLKLDYVANIWEGKKVSHTITNESTGDCAKIVFRANRFNNTINSVIAMVKSGAGIGLIPDFLFYPCQRKKELENIIPGYVIKSVPVYSVHAYESKPPLSVKICADAIKVRLQQKV